jgi:hypothetical protein
MDIKVVAKIMTEDLMCYFLNLLKMKHGFDEGLEIFNIDESSQKIRFFIIKLLESDAYEEFSSEMETEIKALLSKFLKDDDSEQEISIS